MKIKKTHTHETFEVHDKIFENHDEKKYTTLAVVIMLQLLI